MHVLIIGPFHSGLLYVPAAKALGIKVSVITTPEGSDIIPDSLRSDIANIIVVPAMEIEMVVPAAETLHSSQPITGAVAGVEFTVIQTAHVAKALGLPGLDVATVEAVHNKFEMRKRLAAAGVRIPRFATADTGIDVEHLAEQVGFPAVVKPLGMVGSIGAARVNDAVELLAAYEDIATDMEGFKDPIAGDVISGKTVLVEEMLIGSEYFVNGCVTQDGDIHVLEYGKYVMGPQPHFVILGYTMYRPEDLPGSDEMAAYIKDVIKALGIVVGPFHAELIMTTTGPVLVEIANRIAGDYQPQSGERGNGISWLQYTLAGIMGLSMPEHSKPVGRLTALQYIDAPHLAGQMYTKIEGWDEIQNAPEVDEVTTELAVGSRIPTQHDLRSRIVGVLFHADTEEALEAFRKKIIDTIHVVA